MSEITPTYCANHPKVETSLRCNHCEKYICAKCAVKMPTGYRCRECVKLALKIFDTALWYDYPLGFLTAAFLSLIASGILSLLGFIGWYAFFIMFAAAPAIGIPIAEAIRFVVRRRRSGALHATICVGLVVGMLPILMGNLLVFDVSRLILQGIYIVLVIPTVYSRLTGLQLFK